MPKISIFRWDIINGPSKTLLISIWENRILQWKTAKAVKEKFWEQLQNNLLKWEPFKKWECRMIQVGWYNLIFWRPFDYEIRQLTILWIEGVIKNALNICENSWIDSISISALTANYLPESECQINDITHLALNEYFEKKSNSGIKEIYLINFDKEIFKL
jgi:hypothetical protein